ncbi:MAG: energy-coupled thiamine transporter ThiT [bacterium]
MSVFVNVDGGLTTAGYALFVIMALAALIAAAAIAGKVSGTKVTARVLAFCAMGVALAQVTSYIKIFKLPYGGSVTLMSMFFIVLIANWYGAGTGILVGFVYGILQFIQEPYFLTVLQVCCDYLLAFAALGIAGFFYKQKNGLTVGYIAGILGRGVFNALAGYLYWMEYMPENFPRSLAAVYPIVYNFSFILAEGVITLIIINIPAVKKALGRIRTMAVA